MTRVLSLDLSKRCDRKQLRSAIARGWDITPEEMQAYKQALAEAMQIALEVGSPREIRGCVSTFQRMVRDEIDQDHHEDKIELAKSGDAKVSVDIVSAEDRERVARELSRNGVDAGE